MVAVEASTCTATVCYTLTSHRWASRRWELRVNRVGCRTRTGPTFPLLHVFTLDAASPPLPPPIDAVSVAFGSFWNTAMAKRRYSRQRLVKQYLEDDIHDSSLRRKVVERLRVVTGDRFG
jgi:hypothetical protein